MKRLAEGFRSANATILNVVRLYKADGSNVDRCRRATIESGAKIVRPGTEGAGLVDELKPSVDVSLDADTLLRGDFQEFGPQEWLLYKPRWSAFYRTELEDFLTARSVDTVVVCGCDFPNCPRTTIYDASQRDYRVVFVSDATSGVYERGIEELVNIGVTVSYFEWPQDINRRFWSCERVNAELEEEVTEAWENVRSEFNERDVTWREAAYIRAV